MPSHPLRALALPFALAVALGAQAPAAPAPTPTPKPTAPSKVAPKAGKARKAKPQDDASVKPEVASIAKARSLKLKAEKRAEKPKLPPVNVNTCSKEQLLQLKGVTPEMADRIISGRPWQVSSRLVNTGVVPYAVYLAHKGRWAMADPVAPKK